MIAKPNCIIVTGRPGSGKTTLARKLAEQLWMPVISRDRLKEGYVHTLGLGHDQLPTNTNGLVTTFFFETVTHYLSGRISIIIEAAFQHRIWASKMQDIKMLADVHLLICIVDAAQAAERHRTRALNDPRRFYFHGDHQALMPGGSDLPITPYSEPELDIPTTYVSTSNGYQPNLDQLTQLLG